MDKSITPTESSKKAREICLVSKIIPVLSIQNIEDAIPLGEALIEGNLPVLEVTLRTPNALEIIKKMSTIKNAIVGVGTLINFQDVQGAVDVGARFGVSPGITNELITACEKLGLPLIGGVSSVSEAMKMLSWGYDVMKFFPAEVSGGIAALKAIGAPLPQISFCPTGGISLDNVANYLSQPNVICVGGSWIATPNLIKQKNWAQIYKLASEASKVSNK